MALVANLGVNSLADGPGRGAAAALVPLVLDPILTGTSLAFACQVLTAAVPDFGAALTRGVRTWPVLIATSILTVLAAIAPTGWLFYFAYRRFEQAFQGHEGLVAVALPFALMIVLAVPGIYLGVRLFVTVPLHFGESHGPLSPLPRSWQLTRGRWWSAAVAFLPLGLLVLALGLPLSLLVGPTGLAPLLLPGNPGLAGGVLALRLVGPLGWTLYMIYCLELIKCKS